MDREQFMKKWNQRPWLPVLLAAALLLSAGTGGVLAYLRLTTPETANSFTADASVNPEISEGFADNVKKNVAVSVGDTGYSVYVRASVVITWQDSAGNVYITPPVEGTDYAVTYNTNDWTKGSDGYWYYKNAVKSGEATTALIKECKPQKEAPAEGYRLNVKIIAQTIQAAGSTDTGDRPAVVNAWGVTVNPDQTISKP